MGLTMKSIPLKWPLKLQASMGFKEGTKRANPILLEPVMSIEIITPEEFMGQVVSDLNSPEEGKQQKWNIVGGPM